MKVLLVGSGGREHALAWKLATSSVIKKLYYWPGNAAMGGLGEKLSLPDDAPLLSLIAEAQEIKVDFLVIGPEKPLAEGVSNLSLAKGIPVFGPSKEAAMLESSKVFAKDVMKMAHIPTADHETVSNRNDCESRAREYLLKSGGVVLKADGLAAGKGVFVCKNSDDLHSALEHLYDTDLQRAAKTVVIEELLVGRECSYFCFLGDCKPTTLGFAVDFKRLKDQDKGPNTGGMGCYTPVPWLPDDAANIVKEKIVHPLLKELKRRQITYIGCLYVGLMWTEQGPKVIEFNVRFGDPEAQVLAIHDKRDWGALMAKKLGLIKQTADEFNDKQDFNCGASITVILASEGYPYSADRNSPCKLNKDIFNNTKDGNIIIFGAAIQDGDDKHYNANGGRLLAISAHGKDFSEARLYAYKEVDRIVAANTQLQYRKDIGEHIEELF